MSHEGKRMSQSSETNASVNPFQRRVATLMALGKEAPLKMDVLERDSIEEATKLAHQTPIETVIVLVLGVIDHIEIAREEPCPGVDLG
jgi:predicted nucleotidyltransferase